MSKYANYTKFFIALLGAVITVAIQFYGTNKYVQMAVALVTALGVYSLPNAKSVV